MEKEDMERGARPSRGIAMQLMGVVLLSLGSLNTMLTLKGGLEPDPFNYLLLAIGAVMLATGIWRSR